MDRINANNAPGNRPPDNNAGNGVRRGDDLDNARPLQRRRVHPLPVLHTHLYREITTFLVERAARASATTVENVFRAASHVSLTFSAPEARHDNIVKEIDINTRPALDALLTHNYVNGGRLETLHVQNVNLTPADMQGIATTFQNLTQLSLINCDMNDESATILAQNFPQTLTDLILSDNNIGPDGTGEIARYLPPNLQRLDLSNNQVQNNGACLILCSLPNSTQFLNLSDNSIEDDLENIDDFGVQFLPDYIPQTLTHLDLSDNNIENEGLIRFVDAIRNRHDDPNGTNISLQSLDLYGNELVNQQDIQESLRYLREDLNINVTL